jgi:O-antigen/teichoic acid export membrane protein
MGRFRQVANNIASSYAVLVATAVYALASLPLALHYLSKERFGLWTLMSSIGGYLSLIDLGMSGSIARLLIDHKDERDGREYGGLIKTGWLVLVTQGFLIFAAAWITAPLLSGLLQIPQDLQVEFIALTRWLGAMLAFNFPMRIFSHILQAHQRVDIINYSQILGLVLNFVALWIFFTVHKGVFSLVWAQLISSVCSVVICLFACFHFRLFPALGAWGRASWARFTEIFDYGKDMFLVAVGTQLIMASQTLIITRRLGLGAAAAWYAGTRTFNLVSQALWRIMIVSAPTLSEMIARGEQTRLEHRFKDILAVSATVSGVAAITFAACNSLFVTVWTSLSRHQSIVWPAANDLLLGIWMVLLSLVTCHNYLVLISKQIGFMRFVYFIEGTVFVILAWYLSAWGLPAVIACSVLCTICFTYYYGVWRSSRYFGATLRQVAATWILPMWKTIAILAPIVAATWIAVQPLNSMGRLIALGLVCGLAGSGLVLRVGLPIALREELARRAPKKVNPLIRSMMRLVRAP